MSERVKALLTYVDQELEKMSQNERDEFFEVISKLIFKVFTSQFEMRKF